MISINRKAVRAAGGTQSDELAAKIKSVTSSTTVGAVFVYDTRNDSDPSWRKRCQGLSWFDEDLNTATRGGRREFPSVALIVADTSGNTSVTIYDLDDPAMPAWMVFNGGNGYAVHHPDNAHIPSSLFALNGRIYLGQNGAGGELCVFDFVEDFAWMIDGIATNHVSRGPLVNRNTTQTGTSLGGSILVNSVVNDVAATYLEGGELDSLGLVRPVIACATDGGVSVIHPNGDVYDQTYTQNNNNKSGHVFWDGEGGLFFSTRESTDWVYLAYENQTLYSDKSSAPTKVFSPTTSSTGAVNFLGGNPVVAASRLSGSGFAVGGSLGLSLFKTNKGNPDESAFAYITSTYNTGYMLGDIRFAGLAGSGNAGQDVADRSVKANTLTKTGSITSTAVATSAELHAYSNFSASNYLSRASDTDFDFGTGDFSVMFWVKTTETSAAETYINRSDATLEEGDWSIIKQTNNELQFYIRNATTWVEVVAGGAIDSNWKQVVVARSGTLVSLYIDGVRVDTGTSSLTMTPSGGSELRIGNRPDATSLAAADASLSLVRISATAPTPQQVADIYEAEKPLFRSGAKCLLQGGDNDVKALSFDKSTELLTAGTGVATTTSIGATIFRGLEVVDTFKGQDYSTWNSGSMGHVSTAGGVSAYNRPFGSSAADGGVIVDLPSIDVRGDINTADTKLPDDGKLHFTGVTTSNGGDVIGHIPIGENENVTVKAHVTAKGYGSNLGTHYANYVLTEQFYRAAGGDVTSAVAEASIVSQESAAGLDATLGVDTSADTAKITVTGDASDRIVWTASVEVIRDAEKSYER